MGARVLSSLKGEGKNGNGMSTEIESANQIQDADIPLERDVFLRTLIRELAGTLQEVVGVEEASGFVSVVGQKIGEQIDQQYKKALHLTNLNRQQVSDVLVDLKKRIKGDFYIIEESDEKIVLGNRVCPFEDKVIGRPAMCMMTSNVFGGIAARNLGYAKVELKETIARGNSGCTVVVYLKPTEESKKAKGREYYKPRE
jgi:predicted ArsR family transcriptional regulator